MLRKYIVFILLILLSFASGCEQKTLTLGIIQITDHPSLNATREGIVDVLQERGYEQDKNLIIDYKNAQGDAVAAEKIAQQFVEEKVDLILALSTQSLKAATKFQKNIPVIFAAVTDPFGAGLNAETIKTKIAGVTDLTPVSDQLDLLRKLVPETKKVGVIFNDSEKYSLLQVAVAEEYAKKFNIDLIKRPIKNGTEAVQATKNLLGEIDAIYLPTDRTVYSKLEEIMLWSDLAKRPVITGETEGVLKGAIASVGINYYQLGRQAGEMAIKVLNNEKKPEELMIETAKNNDMVINLQSAKELGFSVPECILKNSKIISNNTMVSNNNS